MEFTIYSIGESVFLEQILMSVAMISGSGSMAKMAAIGGILGVIIVMIQAIFQGGQRIDFQHVLLGWIIYACLFGPTARVLVEDVYSGHVRVVDNVPISVGIAGGMISKIGYGVTELFEQGFAAIEPGQNRRRYMESLSVINELHRNGNDSAIFTALNTGIGPDADLRQSWQNYIRECTLTKIDLGEANVDTVMHAPIDEALRFDSAIYGTRLFLGSVEDVTCSEAFPKLQAATGNIKDNPAALNALNRIMGYDQANANGEQSPMDKAQGAFDSLMLTTANAYDFVKVSILEPVYLEAVTGRYQDVRDYSSAIMINQAIAQRNLQWAAEQSMFMTVARPLMAFFEGFIYAVTPVLAFLIMLGGMGLTLAVKYVQSLLWIQLWMPTLAVTNLYIHSAASSEMVNKLGYTTDTLNSMYALNTTADVLSNWIAVGGMLAAATPIISLFFVTGSTYAFTSLAQRIGGSDHVDEKQMAPDVIKSGPYAQMDAKFTGDQLRGFMASGGESLMTGITMGGNLSNAVSSAETTQHQKSEAFVDQLSKSWQSALQKGNAFEAARSIGNTLSSSSNEGVQAMVAHARQIAENNKWGHEKTEAFIGALGINAAAGWSAKNNATGMGGSVGISGEAGYRGTDQSTFGFDEILSSTDSSALNFTDQSTLIDQIASGSMDSSKNSWAHALSDTDGQNLSRTASELVSANQTYSSLSTLQTSGGATFNTDMRTLGSQVAGDEVASSELNRLMQTASPEARKEAARLEQRYKSDGPGGLGMSPAAARDAARLTALTNPVNYTGGDFAQGFNSVAGVVGQATGRNLGVDADPMKNAALSGPNVGDVKGAVGGAVRAPERLDSSAVREKAHTGVDGRDKVNEFYQKSWDERIAAAEEATTELMAGVKNEAIDSLVNNEGPKVNVGTQMFAGTSHAIDRAQDIIGGNLLALKVGAPMKQWKDKDYDTQMREGRDKLQLTQAQADVYASYRSGGYHPKADGYPKFEDGLSRMREEIKEHNPGMTDTEIDELHNSIQHRIQQASYTDTAVGSSYLQDVHRYNLVNKELAKKPRAANPKKE